jgi:hypothetical protein
MISSVGLQKCSVELVNFGMVCSFVVDRITDACENPEACQM